MPELLDLADKYCTDKGTIKGSATGFALVYEHLFGHLRNEYIRLLEVGLDNGGPEHGGNRFERIINNCPSIEMWHEFFSKGDVWGFDINSVDVSVLDKLDRFTFFKGDQGNVNSYQHLEKLLIDKYGDDHLFDFIIEDGSHAFYHQQMSFSHLSKFVKPGGFYIIEDLQWQPDENKGGGKAGGGAPFDVSKLPHTVNTRKLFNSIYIGPRNESLSYMNSGPATDEQFKDLPRAFSENQAELRTNLVSHIDLLRKRRPEYADILLNESKKYDKIILDVSALRPKAYASRVHYDCALVLRKKDY